MNTQADLFSAPVPRIKTIIDHAKEYPDLFSSSFISWLPDNLHIWNAFAAEALKVRARGYKHYSARTIIEHLRHHSALTESTGEWKINNNNTTPLAHLFDLRYPENAGLFEYRVKGNANADE